MKKLLSFFLAILFITSVSFGQTNSGFESGSPSSQEYVPPQLNPLGCENILLYTDDPYNEPDFADIALQNLGYAYTGYYNANFAGFETALGSSSWDIVIFANDQSAPPQSTFDALLLYVQAGGKLIYHSWIHEDQPFSIPKSTIPLETALGVTVLSYSGTPIPVYRWNTSHPLFNTPNTVPDLTVLGANSYVVDSWYTDPIPLAVGLAGYTGAPSAGQCGFVVSNNGNTIYQGWMDANIGDADTDGKNDQVELYENMLSSLCSPEPVPVSDWAVVVGMILIALALTFRFIRR